MEAMLKLGLITNAKNHYEYATELIEKEMGVKSFQGFKNIHRKIMNFLSEKTDIDISNVEGKLGDKDDDSAFYCDLDYFKFLYNVQKKKSLRQNEYDLISLITLNERIEYDEDDIKKWVKHMTDILKNSLRSSDAFTFWNDNQILMLLHEVKDNGKEIIEKRIREKLDNSYDIRITFEALLEDSILSESY